MTTGDGLLPDDHDHRYAPRLRHLDGLDGLRGLAVLGVLAFHSGFSWAVGGYLGVSAFFTLSGFLIMSLLLLEREASGTIQLRRFWSRRFRRLLPAALLALGLILVFGAIAATPDQVRALRGDVFAALAYCANWRFMLSGRTYTALFSAPSPVQHFWSLSIEEQFYLVFPLVAAGLLAVGARSRHLLGYTLAALALLSTGLMALLASPGGDTSRVYYGTDTRMAELLVGAVLAVLVTARPGERLKRRSHRSMVMHDVVGAGALLCMLAMWWRVEQVRPWLYHGGLLLHAVFVAVIIVAVRAGGFAGRALSLRPLVALGLISYGVYLFHWPVFLWLDEARTGLPAAPLFALRFAVTIALAVASYRFLEMPIRTGRRLTGWRPAFVAPTVAAVVLVAVVAVTMHAPAPSIVLAPVSAAPPPSSMTLRSSRPAGLSRASTQPATTAALQPIIPRFHRPLDTARPERMLVVGDSVGVSLGRGLERWGLRTHQAAVWNRARFWCSIGRYALRPLMGDQHPGEACDSWEQRWTADVQRFDPDSAVVLSTIWEIIERKKDGWDGYHHLGEPVYDDWLLSEYERAVDVLSAHGAKVLWMTIPCLRGASAEERARIDDYNHRFLPRLHRARPCQVEIVDLASQVCPRGRFTSSEPGVDDFRPDGTHFSDAGADWVASWLMPYAMT